jgi:mono/diheme cytochrome c family protein
LNINIAIAVVGWSAAALVPAPVVAPVVAQQAARPMSSVWAGVYTEAQSTRGKALYADTCASCHQADLSGGDIAPPLAGAMFNANWTGLTLADLFERVRVSMPQDNPGKLSRQQVADVLALMLDVGRFPAGGTELPSEQEALTQIKFEATKP